MSGLPDITDVENRPREDVQQEKTKPNVFVSTTALVADRVIPVYSVLESQSKLLRNVWLTLLAVAIFCVWVISFTYAVLISDNPVPRGYRFSTSHTIFFDRSCLSRYSSLGFVPDRFSFRRPFVGCDL